MTHIQYHKHAKTYAHETKPKQDVCVCLCSFVCVFVFVCVCVCVGGRFFLSAPLFRPRAYGPERWVSKPWERTRWMMGQRVVGKGYGNVQWEWEYTHTCKTIRHSHITENNLQPASFVYHTIEVRIHPHRWVCASMYKEKRKTRARELFSDHPGYCHAGWSLTAHWDFRFC